jgi:uncharacterized membrane protein
MSGPQPRPTPAPVASNSNAEIFAGIVSICLWFALFVAGTFIGTPPYREILTGEAEVGDKLWAFIVVLFCYTATNAALLCCLASVLGGIFRRMRNPQREQKNTPSLFVLLFSLVLQGFVVYLVMVAGVISFGGWEHFLDAPTREQYMRLAATSSLISLMIGYSPSLFNNLIRKLEKWTQEGTSNRDTARSEPPREGQEV